MQVIKKTLPDQKGKLTATLKQLEIGEEACKISKDDKNKVYVTINRLKKKGMQFTTEIEGNDLFVWRIA